MRAQYKRSFAAKQPKRYKTRSDAGLLGGNDRQVKAHPALAYRLVKQYGGVENRTPQREGIGLGDRPASQSGSAPICHGVGHRGLPMSVEPFHLAIPSIARD